MTIYSKAQVYAAYMRAQAAGISHEQSILAVAQSMCLPSDTVKSAVSQQQPETAGDLRPCLKQAVKSQGTAPDAALETEHQGLAVAKKALHKVNKLPEQNQ